MIDRSSSCKDLPPVAKILASQLPETALADELLTRKLEFIKEADQDVKDDYRSRQIKGCPARLKTAAEFVHACLAAENQNANAMMIDHIIANSDIYPIVKLENFIELRRETQKSSLNWGYDTLFKYVYQYLEKEYHQGARDSDDWSIDVTPDCHCEDCEKLTSFLRTRDQIEKAWPLRKDDRQHIHRVISELSIPVSHETQRTGRPFSLILKKKPKLHQDAKKHFALVTKLYTKLSHNRPAP